MSIKMNLLSVALLAAGLAVATFPSFAQQPRHAATHTAVSKQWQDPAGQVEAWAHLLRTNDLAGLAQSLLPPARWEEVRLVWELKRIEPISAADRAEFADKAQRFTAPDAVDVLMAEIEPKLEQARPQAQSALLMGFGALGMAVASPDSDLTDDQRDALRRAMPGLQRWANGTDFLSSDAMRSALTLLTDAARSAGVNDIDQLRAMSLEALLDRASNVFAAAKDALQIYGLDLDAIADSLQVEVLDIGIDTARVRTTVTVFDAPLWSDHELVLVDGRWFGKHAVNFDADHDHTHHPDHDEDVES